MENKVAGFLARFHAGKTTEETFLYGCCYWFAVILCIRFLGNGAQIQYDEIANHFGTKIEGRVYDITGDVTERYHWEPWDSLDDDALRSRVTRDSVLF